MQMSTEANTANQSNQVFASLDTQAAPASSNDHVRLTEQLNSADAENLAPNRNPSVAKTEQDDMSKLITEENGNFEENLKALDHDAIKEEKKEE